MPDKPNIDNRVLHINRGPSYHNTSGGMMNFGPVTVHQNFDARQADADSSHDNLEERDAEVIADDETIDIGGLIEFSEKLKSPGVSRNTNCTANGARKVVARYLDTGILTLETVKGAMRKLAHLITHSEKAQHYTLNALGNNISRYVDAPKRETASAAAKRVLWDFVCAECGATAAGFYPEAIQPKPAPCTCSGCHGLMIPKRG